ncbi:MAG: glycerophosphodiester phosphodiesterase family protein [bacterium]
MKTLKEFGESGKLLVAAHRGSSGNAPENTISAFRLAYEEGANMIETDLQFTSDGYIVAVHDLHRFEQEKIRDIQTLEDFKMLDAGEWFDSRFKGEKIPQLEEILDFAKDKLYLNLELKVNNKSIEAGQIEYMLKIIYRSGLDKNLMFSSFNYSLLKLIKTIDSGIHTAVINIPGKTALPSEICEETNSDAFICSLYEINDTINEDIVRNNLFLGVYSVDNIEQFDFISKYKVSAIGTNYPKVINDILKERKK